MDGMDLDLMSSYAYFEAKAKENDGWYFAGWSFTKGDTDLGGHVDTDTEEDKGYLFKIFPSDLQGWSKKSKKYAYATFKPVMVSDYKVNGIINGKGNSTTVTFDAVGERVSAADFTISVVHATNGDSDGNWSASITSCTDNKVTVTVTYSGNANGEFRGNVTLASQSGCSQLTAAVYARVGATSDEEASLYNNKVIAGNLVESDDLTKLIGKATATQIVALNANYDKTLTVNRDVTIFTNGYRINTLNVTSGLVTIAFDKYEGGADTVSVTGGKLVLNGGEFGTLNIGSNGEVEQNGATFTGAATNNGKLTTNEGVFNGGLTSTKTLTINNGRFSGGTAVTVSGGTADINRGVIEGTTCGLEVIAGTVTIKKLAAIKGATNSILSEGGTVNVECGKFDGLLSTVTSFTSGYFKDTTHAENVKAGKKWMQLTDGVEYNEGYRFFLGTAETAQNNGVGVCRIGDVSYAKLEDAIAYANNNPGVENIVIFMTNDYTLPAGYYTLPVNATIVVPMSDTQQKINLTAPRLVYNDVNNAEEDKYSNNIPFEFRRLTFAKGVNLDVFGKIELTCTQYQSNEAYTSQPVGAYGHLVMEEGSHMTLQSGSEVRAWGFMTGKGETDARRGAVVREMFQMGDWKGAMTSVLITGMVAGTGLEGAVKGAIGGADSGDFSDKKIFPVSQYFIQNVESPVKYHPGALLSTSAAVSEGVYGMSISMAATDIAIVGVSGEHTAIFLMDQEADAENTWVRKWYDVENDVQTYEINSGAHIGSMELDMGGVSLGGASIPVRLNSAMFDLPITSNFKIHLLSGSMDFEQNTSLLPGSEVEVDKESTVSISMSTEDKQAKELGTPGHVYHTGAVYVYDAAQWDTYAYDPSGAVYTKVVRYVPSVGGQPTKRTESSKPASAKINVHGTFNTADGFVYTTASGANIFSNNEDAGTFIFNNAGEDAGEREVWQIKGKGTKNSHYTATTFTCAQLKNKDNSYTATEDAIAGFAFLYRDDKWQEPMTQTETDMIVTYNSNCFAADVSMMTYCDIDYNNPLSSPMNETVKNTVAKVHAPLRIREYLIADAFAKASGFESGILPHEYEYFRATYYSLVGQHGKEKGEQLMQQGMLNSGNATQVAAAGLVPLIPGFKTQAEEYNETYDLGSAVQKLSIKPQEWLEIAGTAHVQLNVDYGTIDEFEESYVNAIEAVQNNNYTACDDIVNEYLDYIESQRMNPAIVSVDGNADHTYSDADGAGRLFILMPGCQWWEVEKKDNLYHCIHPNNDTYYYWNLQHEAIVNEDGEPTGEYTAGWDEKRFTITWKNWDGTIIQTADAEGNPQDAYSVTYGTMAEFLGTNPTREKTIDYTYDFTGWSPALGKVTSDVTYTATFDQKPRMYTIIFQNEGGVEIERQFLTHNEVPVCENVPTKVGHTLEWSPAIAAVTDDATYRAIWHEDPPTQYEVTFFDYDGKTPLQQSDVAVGAMPEYTEDTPTGKATWAAAQENKEFTYVFDRWSPEIEKVSATSIKSYTAVYVESPLEYTITFKNEDNSVRETQKYHYGETPVCSDLPTKAATAQYTYTLRWVPQIQTVMEDTTYKAVFDTTTNKYTVTLKSDPASACTFTGAGTFNYGTTVKNVAVSYDSEAYEFLGWADLTGAAKTATTHSTFTLTGDITIVANLRYKGDDKVTITWNNWDGSVLGTSEPKVNAATTYTGATPTKPAEAAYTYTFDGWTDARGTFYKNNQTPKATVDATYYAHFTAVPVPDLTISNDNGAPTVLSAAVNYHDLIITSDGATYSGQLVGSNYLTLTGNAHFDLAINAKSHTWYAVAVPWQVDPTSGISVNGRTLTFGRDFDVLYYDGSVRAAGEAAWKYLELKEGDKTIQPGTLYMIGLMMDAPVIRFTKNADAPLLTTATSVTAYASSTGSDTDANWNGIANPALFSAYVNAGATLGQVYNNDGSDSYSTIYLNTTKLLLGQPVFVQAPADKNITVSYGGTYAAAPRRAKAAETSEYELRISTYGAKYTDRLFVQADENKEQDRYTIGQDLAKMGVSTRVAQMWINRYGAKLCMNTFAPINGVAEYPLGIYTPKNGEYRLSLATTPDSEASIYLTYDGEAIWNLANGAYVADLEKGTNSHYGIRITVKKTPEIATGIDEAVVDSKDAVATKVLIGNQVFIIRGEKVYSIDGQLVK